MIEYIRQVDSNIVTIIIEGKITENDFERVVSQLKSDLEKHHKLRVLKEVRHFEGIDPPVFWKDTRFGFAHLKDFTHAAFVADAQWMRTMTEVFSNIFPTDVKVKVFEPSQIDEAKKWLADPL